MPTQVQFRRGTATQNNAFTGAAGELSINSDNNALRIHDGSTAGGYELAKADLSNTSGISSVSIQNLNVTGLSTFVGVSTHQATLFGTQLSISGVTTFRGLLNVGAAGTVITATTAGRVGINSTIPAYTLDVGGVINSSTEIRVGGVSVLTTASNDALALAIALG
jgi:hypothetical protein